jgi:hypothetical protein
VFLNRVKKPCHSTFIGFINIFVKHPYFFLIICASIYLVRERKKKRRGSPNYKLREREK